MAKSAYIHIPFCKSKCNYCSFVSYSRPELMNEYAGALLRDIKKNYGGEKLNTLYFGGGTPSLLPVILLEKITGIFNLSDGCELTVEINPDDTDLNYLKQLKDIGVNRLSIGAQTFDDRILKLAGRRHGSSDIVNSVNFAKEAGFKNISLDLIYGLPEQSSDGLMSDIEKLLSQGVQHISTYGLKIEEEAFWGKNPPKNLPDDDTQADMYEMINEILEQNGFLRYEISNFSGKGFESKHNLNYWNNNEYYGFGASAHGFIRGIRYSKFRTLEDYISKPETNEYEKILTEKEKLEEEIFLGFRKREGINVNEINRKFRIDFEKDYKKILEKYREFFLKTPSGFALNLKGVLISNLILSEFI